MVNSKENKMKELVIDKNSWSYRVATKFGDLHVWDDSQISSCEYWGVVFSGSLLLSISSLLALAVAVMIQDFLIWVIFSLFVTFVAPGPAAGAVMFLGALVAVGGAIFGIKYGVDSVTEKFEAAKTVKESIIDKICIPVRFK